MPGSTITIVGNITADPELRYTQNGTAVASFTLAHTPRTPIPGRQGEFADGETTYLRCNIWRAYAENVAGSLQKGQSVIVLGRLQQRNWEKDGQKRQSYELEVDECGPALRFATATVQRVQRREEQVVDQVGERRSGRRAAEPADAPF